MNTANKITMVRLALIPVCIVFLMIDNTLCQWLAAAVFLIASATDFLDGYIARKHDQVTDFGKFIDPIADKILVISAMITLCGQGRIPSWMVNVFVAREFIISGFRLVAATKDTVIAAGNLGKYKTATQMVAIVLLVITDRSRAEFGIANVGYIVSQVFLYASLLLAVVSCAVYIRDNIQVLDIKR